MLLFPVGAIVVMVAFLLSFFSKSIISLLTLIIIIIILAFIFAIEIAFLDIVC